MAFRAVRDEPDGRGNVRFYVDEARGRIRHVARGGKAQEFQIEAKEGGAPGFKIRPVDDSARRDIESA